ncbi:active breakpoint cluster region-related protein-like isoform X2 [Scyliorhinus torazame]|uniref:active breakpoint cluster region-related protein-like isoform X2 n=1 Tax=Scyliorhinus torazame TaxID=75743 RepID=UPI003B59F0FB
MAEQQSCSVLVSEDSREDPEDDQVFTLDSDPTSADIQSDSAYTSRSSDGSVTFSPICPDTPLEEDPERKLQTRKRVLKKILENERIYVSGLESLLVPLRPLKAAAYTSQPVLTSQEIQAIFFKIPELHDIHKEFYSKLKERIEGSNNPASVADLFQQQVKQFGVYRAFINNYPIAKDTTEKCVQTKEQFRKIAEKMWVKHSKDSSEPTTTFEALLHTPVSHLTRLTLLIKELLFHTPREHSDYCQLEGALNDSNIFLAATNQKIQQKNSVRTKAQHLVKDGYVVEVTENTRKLRRIFLSPDLFFCVRVKKQAGRQPQCKCEWYIALEELSFQSQSDINLMAPGSLQMVAQSDVEGAKGRLMETKIEIYLEKKHNKRLDRLKKKLFDIESWLLINSPAIPLGLQDRNGKSYLFLLSSEYELHDWQESIERLKKHGSQAPSSPSEIQTLIHGYIGQQEACNLPLHSNLEDPEEKTLKGTMSLKIHSLSGFTQLHDVYCCFEADTNGYFEKKAQTTVLNQVKNPQWEDEVEIQLDGTQSLRILMWEQHDYRVSSEQRQKSGGDRLMARAQIWLDPKTLLSKEWKQNLVGMNRYEMSYSVRYLHQSLSQLDEFSGAPRGIFGVPISIVTYRDRSRVPLIVRHCVEDVERRGLDELGIYRISGIATDVQSLRAAFDSNPKEAVTHLKDYDVNVVAGTLKLYFRELPEPLLTDELIPSFVAAAAQEDATVKEREMTSFLSQLPDPNLNTFLYLMKHLKKVTEHEPINKMSLHNLATVFGPSLLRVRHEGLPMDVSHEVVAQVQVIYYFLSDDNISLLEQRERLGSVTL